MIKIIKKLGKETSSLQEKLEEYEDEISCLTTENSVWSRKLEETKKLLFSSSKKCDSCTALEKELAQLKDSTSMSNVSHVSCDNCTALENELAHVKDFASMSSVSHVSCDNCIMLEKELKHAKNCQSSLTPENDLLVEIIDKLDVLTTSINEKTVNQTVFVKQRYGIGYPGKENSKDSCSAENEKLRRELVEKNETLNFALQTSRDKNQFL